LRQLHPHSILRLQQITSSNTDSNPPADNDYPSKEISKEFDFDPITKVSSQVQLLFKQMYRHQLSHCNSFDHKHKGVLLIIVKEAKQNHNL
jgi:hypothetical protein